MKRAADVLFWAGIALLFFIACWPAPAHPGAVSFSPPRVGMKSPLCCLADTVPLRSCYSVALYVFGQQSPTWVAKRDSMLSSPAVWTRYWPAVRLEAEPRQTSSVAICPPFPVSIALPYPDSLRGRAGFVIARNSAGGFCWSNRVALP